MLTSSLDLDGVVAEVDFERDQILELREQLSGKRDYIGGAGGVVLSVLALRQQGGEGSLGIAPSLLAIAAGLFTINPGLYANFIGIPTLRSGSITPLAAAG